MGVVTLMLPSSHLSKSQVDKLGDRLRGGAVIDDDLMLLDRYRRSFSDAYEIVVREIRNRLGLEATGRQEKTKDAIIAKLRRQNTRLSQMQDIAGCRIVVPDLLSQNEVVERLKSVFDRTEIDDRREHPSHGYRAVHVIVIESGKLVEVQVRTSLQHLWAVISEKLAGTVDINIKYGQGDRDTILILNKMSQKITEHELAEASHLKIMASDDLDPDEEHREGPKLYEIMMSRISIIQMLEAVGKVIPNLKGKTQ